MNTAITVRIKKNNLPEEVIAHMWGVYQKHYNYTYQSFLKKMAKSTHYSLYYAGGKMVGFTGLRINRMKVNGKKRLLMYFGQTVVESAYRGKNLIQITGMKLVLKYFADIVRGNAWCWCDALTYSAYLVFAKSIPDFYPSFRHETPTSAKQLMDNIGRLEYEVNYDPRTGIICEEVKLVNDHTVEANEQDLRDHDIHFYVNANPMYVLGHGLLTMAPVNFRNILQLTKRYFNKRRQFKRSSAPVVSGLLALQA